jgi:histidinol-phosphatase (PHP family)
MCQKAIDLGIDEIGFSEHMEFDPSDEGYGYFSYDHYTRQIKHAQSMYDGQLLIRKGIEIDYQSCFEDDIKQWLRGKHFDYRIGSVHYLDHRLIDHTLLSTIPIEEAYHSYFTEVQHAIDCRLFDVIGHLDLLHRYASPTQARRARVNSYEDVETILQDLVRQKLYLELNLKGLQPQTGEPVPNQHVIFRFFRMGGRYLSIGSDAHAVHELTEEVNKVQIWLRECAGYDFVLPFQETLP